MPSPNSEPSFQALLRLRDWMAFIDERDAAYEYTDSSFRGVPSFSTYHKVQRNLEGWSARPENAQNHALYATHVFPRLREIGVGAGRFSKAFARAFPQIPIRTPDAPPP